MLNNKEFIRYSRQLMLPDVGNEGQLKLKQSKVLLIGCGGLGHAAAQYLVSAGIGHITLVDGDVVELSNLQRQILFREQHIGLHKAQVIVQQLRGLNPHCHLDAVTQHFTEKNADALLMGIDWVLDCTDNFKSRLLINQYCQQQRISQISAAAIAQQGQVMLWPFAKSQAFCYRCLFPALNDHAGNCQSLGILAPLVGVVGAMQALLLVQQIMKPATHATFWQFDGEGWRFTNYQLEEALLPSAEGNSPVLRCAHHAEVREEG